MEPFFNWNLRFVYVKLNPTSDCRASLGWFCHQPEWYETNNGNFAHSEGQSVHAFVQFLLNQRMDVPHIDVKGQAQENGNTLHSMVRQFFFYFLVYTRTIFQLIFAFNQCWLFWSCFQLSHSEGFISPCLGINGE